LGTMREQYDVAVIGGAFSGASAALTLRRRCPSLRVAVVERSTKFDRKVGEATTEVSGSFMTKRLNLAHHLNHHHLPKQGLRFWFTQGKEDAFERCGELGAFYQVRLPSYQIDREVLDAHVLKLAEDAGAAVFRPAKVAALEFGGDGADLTVLADGETRDLRARWVIDASGRAAVLGRKFKMLHALEEHPTNSIWARFRKVRDWDGHELHARFPAYAKACQASRAAATNHLAGYGWWCWIIPLKGGDYSAGLVYDARLFTPPAGATLGERLKAHLLTHPVGREIFGEAEYIEGDVKAYSNLPYFVDAIAGPGWHIVGDAAGFMDPLYSQGLDYCAWTVTAAVNRICDEAEGREVSCDDLNERFHRSYRGWFESLYKDKYYYLGDKELMTAAFLLDLGLYFLGPVRTVVNCPKGGLDRFPFDGPVDGKVVRPFMSFYNRRLAYLARKRQAAGIYGAANLDTRTLIRGFEPSLNVNKLIRRGIKVWLRAEMRSAFLPAPPKEARVPMAGASVPA